MKLRIRQAGKILLLLLLIFLLGLGFLYLNNDIGLSDDRLAWDFRQSQKIQNDWRISGTITDTMAAYIAYPEDRSDHTFAVYVNRPGLSFGYFFRGGGDIVSVERAIAEYTVEGYRERAFISLNTQGVVRVEIDNGNEVEIIPLTSSKPFTLVLPLNAGEVTFYNEQGQVVEYQNQRL